ncbi:taste receptor type 2 member 40-like [Parus major]|uniref:taste receptor type 2 member 40-like n=1 Tax=Parus major TaxID=9157 RepID=UPI0007711A50|nr:taste receptor type 2 member 40-like [Parus major]XP_033372731.1 taste receptor type 2 member 40-like [Parus major]XP_033372733.1 taste receptor type 2 member 40-like [Parus major]XP_033372734.1 taste receptor type 2 member 40-like [Parus major]XP_033372735.1 taste receptor type 2 member 40-like [Parus major]XP_033372737.1 taste receptor type 2 member 40-like [Parus major]XP_033372742.1 taste receptor type 2 member 40-like [Parus major]XP_033372745.1 taste receptor type 2 member 40-like [
MTSFALFFQAISITESMAGLLGTGIILAVSLLSCIRGKTWSPYDLIMISMSSSRFIFHSWNIVDLFINIWHEQYYSEESRGVVSNAAYVFLNYCSLWFGAWLSVFYCIKTTTFTQSFFIWLKQRIARLVPWMLLTSWFCSFIAAIPFIWDDYSVQRNFTTPQLTTNTSAMRTTWKDSLGLVILLCNASTALILSVVSSVLLIRSLWIHRRRMQNNASGFTDPSSEAHISAIKSVFSFLIIYIIYFICLLVLLCSDFLPFSDEESICAAVLAACPTGHTLVLIWSNPKFREQPARIWHHINCHGRTAST